MMHTGVPPARGTSVCLQETHAQRSQFGILTPSRVTSAATFRANTGPDERKIFGRQNVFSKDSRLGRVQRISRILLAVQLRWRNKIQIMSGAMISTSLTMTTYTGCPKDGAVRRGQSRGAQVAQYALRDRHHRAVPRAGGQRRGCDPGDLLCRGVDATSRGEHRSVLHEPCVGPHP